MDNLPKVGQLVTLVYSGKLRKGTVQEYKRGRDDLLMLVDTEQGFRSFKVKQCSDVQVVNE